MSLATRSTPYRVLLALGLLGAIVAVDTSARAEEITVGVFIPQSRLSTNAERSAWADALAAHIAKATEGRITARTQVFARREDAKTMSTRLDILISDGLFAAELGGEVIAHAAAAPAVGLYAVDGSNLSTLKGKPVAFAASGTNDAAFYSNTALAGEVSADGWFSELRDAKDAASALNMVRTGSVPAAFGPVDHPAAAGLTLINRGGAYAAAVVVVMNRAHVDPLKRDLVAAILAPGGGGQLGAFSAGMGDALVQIRAARGGLRALGAQPILAESPDAQLRAPPIRLRARGRLPPPSLGAVQLPKVTLSEEP